MHCNLFEICSLGSHTIISGLLTLTVSFRWHCIRVIEIAGDNHVISKCTVELMEDCALPTLATAGKGGFGILWLLEMITMLLAITVGSTTITDLRSSSNDLGPCVDVHVPGSSILLLPTQKVEQEWLVPVSSGYCCLRCEISFVIMMFHPSGTSLDFLSLCRRY